MSRNPFIDPELGQRHHHRRIALAHNQDIDSVPSNAGGQAHLMNLSNVSTVFVAFVIMAGVLVILIARLFQLQLLSGSTYRLRSEGNRIRSLTTPAPRGTILDRYGLPLAVNVPDIALTIIPADLPKDVSERTALIQRLATAIAWSPTDIEQTLKKDQRRPTDPVTIIEHVPYDQALRFIVSTADIPPVNIVAVPNRSYPLNTTTAGVLGYTGRISPAELQNRPETNPLDVVGKTGLEREYNDVLTGTDGIKQVERDVRNHEQRIVAQQDPVPGKSITTSIDSELQQHLADRLGSMVKSLHTTGGAAVALDPNNGEVLAMVSVPSYDNNWFVAPDHAPDIQRTLTDGRTPLLNRVISGQYPSGSIVKPLIATAALTERTITPSTTVLSVGGFKVGNDFFPDWKAGGHGLTNVTKAIADSVNTFFYAVGGGFDRIVGLGVDRIVEYLQRFGWGEKLGIDLPNEQDGLLPTKEWRTTQRASPWKLGDTYHLSIGQGDLEVTPLQVATAMAAVANGGTLYQPHLVTAVQDANGTVVQHMSSKVISDRLAPGAALATVQTGMREGVLNGSSRAMQSLPVTSAAKTGTAQFGADGKTHAWFAAYAPYDHPRVVIVVLVEAGGEGHAAALPVAKDVLQWYFTSGAGAKK